MENINILISKHETIPNLIHNGFFLILKSEAFSSIFACQLTTEPLSIINVTQELEYMEISKSLLKIKVRFVS